MQDRPSAQYETLQPLVTNWLAKINNALRHHKWVEFQDVAEQCYGYFAGQVGFMWDTKFRKKFMGGAISPKFKITMNKAFELVAIYPPMLYHQNPIRVVRSHKRRDYAPAIIAESMGVPAQMYLQMEDAARQVQEAYQQQMQPDFEAAQLAMQYERLQAQISYMMRLEQQERDILGAGCEIMQDYLSYTPYEQPNGGLEQAALDAICEMFIKGRGVLWVEPFRKRSSQRKLTGAFFDTCDYLISDPDSKSFNFGESKWVARMHRQPTWEVERQFRLPKDSLEGKGQHESSEAQSGRSGLTLPNYAYQTGETHDVMTWWEVFSIGGVGTRLKGARVESDLHQAFDDVVGDFGYIAVCEGVPWPLNMHIDRFRAATDEDIRKSFDWPTPYYRDERWPCAVLEAYRDTNGPYPIAPLRPALGDLTFLNVILSALANNAWEDSRNIVACIEDAAQYVETALKGGQQTVVLKLKRVHEDLNKIISQWKRQPTGPDAWNMLARMFDVFDKRVGLEELRYGGQQSGISRSATDVAFKREMLDVRPAHMAKRVDAWMADVARMEKMCAYFSGVNGQDIRPLVGSIGARIWDRFIASADQDLVIHEMDCVIGTGSRKPNKDRDAENMGQIYQPLSQQCLGYAQVTTDTGPLNDLNAALGEAIEQEMPVFGPWAPPPPAGPSPEELELAIEERRAETEMAGKVVDLQLKAAGQQQEMATKAAEHEQELVQDQEKHEQEMAQSTYEFAQKALQSQQEAAINQQILKAKERLTRLGGGIGGNAKKK